MAFDPTAWDQELMQLTNRFRTDPQHEYSRLMVSTSPRKARDANVDFSLSYFNTNMAIVEQEMSVLQPVAPVAWDPLSQQVALDYLPLMAAAKSSSHNLAGSYQERIGRYPFDTSRGITAGENLFANAFSPVHAHASYVFEWGSGPNGLQATRGHRNTLVNPAVKQAGMAFLPVTYEPTTGFGPNLNAQEFIGLGATPPVATGAVFQDANGSGWYDAGEGLAGVQITFDGPSGHFVTNGLTAGGYDVALPPGVYTATASGGGMRYPVSIPGVAMGSSNIWLNFIYDPAAVPADARERNDDWSTATPLAWTSQTISDGTIHRGDVDYFRVVATSDGPMRVDLRFSNSSGDLNLRLLDGIGVEIAHSSTSSDLETTTVNVVHGKTYYLVVEPAIAGSTGGPYSLQLTVPAAQAPAARPDSATTDKGAGTFAIDVLANDADPDGDIAAARVQVVASGQGAVQLTGDARQILYTPPTSFSGIDRLSYMVVDAQGLASPVTMVSVMVLDFTREHPFTNASQPLDVNGDGTVSAIDALLVINELNARGARSLPRSSVGTGGMFGLVDVNGSDSVEPLDVLLVINHLNTAAAQSNPSGLAGVGEASLEAFEDSISAARRRR